MSVETRKDVTRLWKHVDGSPKKPGVKDGFGTRHPNQQLPRKSPSRRVLTKKNRLYYRRTGALWTDLYHTPAERLHLVNHRPDLDAVHAEYVESRRHSEEENRRQRVRDRRRFRQRQRARMRRRQNVNALHAAVTSQLEHKAEMKMRPVPRDAFGHRLVRKDREYYRRTGALWTDLVHASDKRVLCVADPRIVEKDRLAAGHIRIKEQEEQMARLVEQQRVRERRVEMRYSFRQRIEERVHRELQVTGKIGRRPAASALSVPVVAGPAVDEDGVPSGLDADEAAEAWKEQRVESTCASPEGRPWDAAVGVREEEGGARGHEDEDHRGFEMRDDGRRFRDQPSRGGGEGRRQQQQQQQQEEEEEEEDNDGADFIVDVEEDEADDMDDETDRCLGLRSARPQGLPARPSSSTGQPRRAPPPSMSSQGGEARGRGGAGTRPCSASATMRDRQIPGRTLETGDEGRALEGTRSGGTHGGAQGLMPSQISVNCGPMRQPRSGGSARIAQLAMPRQVATSMSEGLEYVAPDFHGLLCADLVVAHRVSDLLRMRSSRGAGRGGGGGGGVDGIPTKKNADGGEPAVIRRRPASGGGASTVATAFTNSTRNPSTKAGMQRPWSAAASTRVGGCRSAIVGNGGSWRGGGQTRPVGGPSHLSASLGTLAPSARPRSAPPRRRVRPRPPTPTECSAQESRRRLQLAARRAEAQDALDDLDLFDTRLSSTHQTRGTDMSLLLQKPANRSQ